MYFSIETAENGRRLCQICKYRIQPGLKHLHIVYTGRMGQSKGNVHLHCLEKGIKTGEFYPRGGEIDE